MLPFHAHFRHSLKTIQQTLALPTIQALPLKSLTNLLNTSISLTKHLEGHHGIEERFIFPLLATRLPQFGQEHLKEHAKMHDDLVKFGGFSESCLKKLQSGRGKIAINEGCGKPIENDEGSEAKETKLKEWPKDIWDSEEMKKLTESLKETLLFHLGEEEASLHPDSIKKAGFTLQELNRIPM